VFNPPRDRFLAALLTVLGLASAALSPAAWPERLLPRNAHFGEMTRFAYPLVTISTRILHMSPGARIYNQQNLMIMPSAMPPRAKVMFTLDTAGDLSGLWLLTAQEAARYRLPSVPWTPAPKAPGDPAKDAKTDGTLSPGRN
jgi:hypothetical protein